MKCKKGYDVVGCKSAAGYYRGTYDNDGFPNCRLSTQYADTAEEAENIPLDRMCAMENSFCNGNGNCFQ